MKKKKINKKLILTIVFVSLLMIATGLFGALLVDAKSEWFLGLSKPPFYPPSIVFSIVWSILYVTLAVSFSAFLYNSKNQVRDWIFVIANSFLNVLWNFVFFNANLLIISVIVLFINVVVAIIITRFMDKNKWYFYLYIPYIVWLIFAFVLNYSIFMLN